MFNFKKYITMKTIFTLLFLAIVGFSNAQGIFNWKTETNKPAALAWAPNGSPMGYSELYKYGDGTGEYPYFMMIGADEVSTLNIYQTEGAYIRFFLPPGIGKVAFGHNDETLAASQCVKYSFVGEFDLSYVMPAQSTGNEIWAWGCGSFNSTYIRPEENIANEGVVIIGYYNEDNMNTTPINFQDFSYSLFIKDTIAYQNWLDGTTEVNQIKIQQSENQIYPNPAQNQITISNKQSVIGNIQILDITGKIVKELTSNNSKQTIDISELHKGIYFVKFGETVQKLIKE